MERPTCKALIHNTERAYRRFGCRCDDIVERTRAAWRRRRARHRRPAGPLHQRAWRKGSDYDHAAVARALLGDRRVRLNAEETMEVVDRLTRRGWSAARIGEHMGCAPRSVVRWRSRLAQQRDRVAA